jgi:hypothetical protein
MEPFIAPEQQPPTYGYSPVNPQGPMYSQDPMYFQGPIYFQGPPSAPGKAGSGQTVAFFISFVLQLVAGVIVLFGSMLPAFAYDSCGDDCGKVDRWVRILVGSGVVAAVCGIGSLIFWFFKTRVAWILSFAVWLSLVVWIVTFVSGSE